MFAPIQPAQFYNPRTAIEFKLNTMKSLIFVFFLYSGEAGDLSIFVE